MYKKEYVQTFLEKQGQLFDEPVADDFEEAEAFLEDCMAVVLDSLKDVKKYLDGMGADVEGLSLKELEEESEVFKLPDGKYLIVEGGEKKRKAEITSLKIKYGKLASTKERMHKSENAGKHQDVKEDGI